ncbi:MipA/OmpV family protein [Erythrobacter sp. BLCC-B19]|uniref:MipA/OmpV family protein n=1 Tax=Erythrobacter sp. BLCC-B19 TaxID=3025315 RepID=UPI00235DF181|nr:MipA/OmpV family protein [Erythrobacter sp. BLCC-B19]WDA39642.1 MipA/OmpV family protein [Erythrobacter sp. BLCC-B19]
MKTASFSRFAPILVLALPSAAFAQDETSDSNDVSGYATIGIAAVPEYEGADDYQILPLVDGRVNFGERYVAIQGTTIRANVIAAEGIEFGPVASFTFGRDGDIANAAVADLGRIKDAYEVGAFAAKTFGLAGNDSLRLAVQGVHDVSDVHGGFVVTASATYAAPVGERLNLLFDLGASYASDDYAETYFAVTPAGAAASGLPQFAAKGGLKDVGAQVTASYRIGDNWGIAATAGYRRLLGDFADSPVVTSGGSADQLSGGVGVFFTF